MTSLGNGSNSHACARTGSNCSHAGCGRGYPLRLQRQRATHAVAAAGTILAAAAMCRACCGCGGPYRQQLVARTQAPVRTSPSREPVRGWSPPPLIALTRRRGRRGVDRSSIPTDMLRTQAGGGSTAHGSAAEDRTRGPRRSDRMSGGSSRTRSYIAAQTVICRHMGFPTNSYTAVLPYRYTTTRKLAIHCTAIPRYLCNGITVYRQRGFARASGPLTALTAATTTRATPQSPELRAQRDRRGPAPAADRARMWGCIRPCQARAGSSRRGGQARRARRVPRGRMGRLTLGVGCGGWVDATGATVAGNAAALGGGFAVAVGMGARMAGCPIGTRRGCLHAGGIPRKPAGTLQSRLRPCRVRSGTRRLPWGRVLDPTQPAGGRRRLHSRVTASATVAKASLRKYRCG